MSKFNEMIEKMKSSDYKEKTQFLEYLVQLSERAKHQFAQEDKDALLSYAYEEIEALLSAIPAAGNYREKALLFECENFLMGLVLNLCASPEQLPQEQLRKIQMLVEMVSKERYIESTVDRIFDQPSVTEQDVNRLLYWVRQTTDEFQKSMLFFGLANHHKEISKMDPDAKQAMANYIAGEIHRLMELGGRDAWDSLELLADVSKHFASDDVTSALMELLNLGRNHINIYALDTLCSMWQDVPTGVVEALARDLEYANTAYHILRRSGKTRLFPAECATEEYLAKSDLVRWLTYPTELGKAPDEIVYIGKIKKLFQKEVFHVFKYRSNSDTLGEDRKNKWLVGWSSDDGGTFSNFDEFAPFERETTKKTLKLIQKQLIG